MTFAQPGPAMTGHIPASKTMRALLPVFALTLFAVPGYADESAVSENGVSKENTEQICDDGLDNDGDTVFDCGDNDCKSAPNCLPDGNPENTTERCGDWIDNDNDGATDCDDLECERTAACRGSWRGSFSGTGLTKTAATTAPAASAPGAAASFSPGAETDRPAFAPETEAADSEGGVGFAGVRFGVVASVLQSLRYDNVDLPDAYEGTLDTRINVLQLRAFGNLPLLEDSFFLVNVRGDRSPRLTFAMFQFPLGGGHYVNLNSGGGTLSNQLIISTAKQPLLQPAFYMFSAFEQGNGAAAEIHGPIVPGWARYRFYVAGGAGFGTGNVGGRRFTFDNFNYTYSAGGQLQLTPIGYYSRFDSPFIYQPVPMALALNIGAKYDQRLQERYPAFNAQAVFRWGHFELYAENYSKYELNFQSFQTAYNIMAGVLLWPQTFFLAADFGQYLPGEYGVTPDELQTDLRRQRSETQFRTALHWYFWRHNGILSLRYAGRWLAPPKVGTDADRTEDVVTHEMWLAAQIRF